MSTSLKMSVSKKPNRKADINLKAITLREHIIRSLFGSCKRIIVLVPGDEIAEITVCRKGENHGQNRTD